LKKLRADLLRNKEGVDGGGCREDEVRSSYVSKYTVIYPCFASFLTYSRLIPAFFSNYVFYHVE
jgi:hypothetical protein